MYVVSIVNISALIDFGHSTSTPAPPPGGENFINPLQSIAPALLKFIYVVSIGISLPNGPKYAGSVAKGKTISFHD